MRLQKQLEQENVLLDMKDNHCKSELELEEVAQEACGIPVLGDVQHLTDLPWCHSFGVRPAELGIGPASPLSFLIT